MGDPVTLNEFLDWMDEHAKETSWCLTDGRIRTFTNQCPIEFWGGVPSGQWATAMQDKPVQRHDDVMLAADWCHDNCQYRHCVTPIRDRLLKATGLTDPA